MLALIFLSGSTVLGVVLIKRATRDLLDPIEVLLWGTVSGWLVSALAAYLVARWFGELTATQLVMLTIVIWSLAVTMIVWNRRSGLSRLRKLQWQSHYRGLAIIILVFTPIFLTLFWTHMFARGAGGIYSGGSAAYDLSFHAALTNSFLAARNFPARYLFLPPESLRYPFLPDFQTAVLVTGHLSLRAAWIVTSLVLALSITALLYFLAHRITRSQLAASFATVIFLLNGGFGFIDGLRDWRRSGQSFVQFWSALDINYTNNPERGLQWPNIITDGFVPQRTILFGLAISLIVFSCFAMLWERGGDAVAGLSPRQRLTLMIFAGVLTGLLPVTHTHSYIAVVIAAASLFAFRPRAIWLGFWIPAIALAAPHIFGLISAASSQGVVHLLPGWLGHDQSYAFPIYLLRNFGLPLALALPAWWFAPREWQKLHLAFFVILAFALTVIVSPNPFDNGKLIYHWHAANSVFVGLLLAMIWRHRRLRLLSIILLLPSVLSGIFAVQAERHAVTLVLNNEEIAAADFMRQRTSAQALFLNAPAFSSPVTTLAGRAVVRGPSAWLASHGYDFRAREADVRRIYAGTADALDLIRYYSIDYIYVGARERELNANTTFFDQNFRRVYQTANIIVYDTHVVDGRAYNGAANVPGPRDFTSRLDRDPNALLEEFSTTTLFVYQLIKATSGSLPRREQFMETMLELTSGLKPGAGEWERQLETNRQLLLTKWTNSAEFTKNFGQRTNTDYVDSLIRNANLDWRNERKQELVRRLDSGQFTRAAALSEIIADSDFAAREYNTAYVLTHFFGYLRRNPDDPPDADLRGLTFWCDRLDTWHDYRAISRAFLESSEYATAPLPQ